MNLRLSKKELIILLSSVLIVILVFFAGQQLYLGPKKQEVENKQTQLDTEQQLLATIQTKVAGQSAPSAESVAELQKKVPVKKQLEQLILALNKAEVTSSSFISNMSFSEGDVAARASDATETVEGEQTGEQGTEQTETSEATEATEATTTEDEPVYQPAPLPEGIKKLNVNLAVTSPNYKSLMKFLGELEKLKRRVVIESVAFSGATELTSVEQEKQEFSYSITLSAFYMPELEDLQDQLPQLEVPEPGNKTNPFAVSPNLSKEETEKE
ncbi:pilus assembly protein PilO [Mesobacillus maritimus]|uniref:pilus assembly protein PilO n=1 Tax=Mesobacillus maritimus TaxID=1643336 RepID=UPI00203DA326|nr:pilus assembly protein PilO [Mesobacillus maritimus]MCM3669910.1 pilus assembly protein PilO [Mesobacillus maritimus]